MKDARGREIRPGNILRKGDYRVQVLEVYLGILWVRWLDLPEKFRDIPWMHKTAKQWTRE